MLIFTPHCNPDFLFIIGMNTQFPYSGLPCLHYEKNYVLSTLLALIWMCFSNIYSVEFWEIQEKNFCGMVTELYLEQQRIDREETLENRNLQKMCGFVLLYSHPDSVKQSKHSQVKHVHS